MPEICDNLFEAWFDGELPAEEARALEKRMEIDEAAALAFLRWLERAEASIPEGTVPSREAVEDILVRSREAAVAQVDRTLRFRRRARTAAVAAAACLAALLAIGTVGGVRGRRSKEQALRDEVCEIYRTRPPMAFPPALGCDRPYAALAGTAPTDVGAIRAALEVDPRPDDPEWLAARVLLALVQRHADEATGLLDGKDALMDAHPRLRSDLAQALLLRGDREGARAQLQRAVSLAPGDEQLRRSLDEL